MTDINPVWSIQSPYPNPSSNSMNLNDFLEDFDFDLLNHSNSFGVYKFRFLNGFENAVRLKIIASELKSKMQSNLHLMANIKQQATHFSFYDISKLENLDLENKRQLLFGNKITRPTQITGHVSLDNSHSQNALKDLKSDINFANLLPGQSQTRFTGTIKLFFEKEKYGFLKSNQTEDVFVSLDELKKAGITQQMLKKRNQQLSFDICDYVRRNKPSRKAINIKIEN